MRRVAWFCLLAGLLAGCGTAGYAIGLAIEASRPFFRALPDQRASRCATDLVRRPDGWYRCGELESSPTELAGEVAEAGAYWP